MKYIALLRGINVGGNRKVDMKNIKSIMESLGYTNVSTYINSGNIIFESDEKQNVAKEKIENILRIKFGFDIPALIKTKQEINKIVEAIPKSWQNNSEQKSDVAYLFKDVDSIDIMDKLPIKKEFLDIRYVKGAIFWNVKRKDYNKSHLNKIISHKLYKSMTVRNVNTARYLANMT
jgi:uncharacterized protein (DUF1697 family)